MIAVAVFSISYHRYDHPTTWRSEMGGGGGGEGGMQKDLKSITLRQSGKSSDGLDQ